MFRVYLQQHVQMFGETHLRLHDAQVASEVGEQAWLASRWNAVDMLPQRLHVCWRGRVEQRRQRVLESPMHALGCRPWPCRSQLMEAEGVARFVALVVLSHLLIVPVEGDFSNCSSRSPTK